jgi:DNA-binding CsgD family transcriptional regulator
VKDARRVTELLEERIVAVPRLPCRGPRILAHTARAALGEARQLAEMLEAAWLADTARHELQLAGGRRRRRSADRDQLTDAEQHVAELAAEGLTNAEIARRLYLSPSTIETHLRHVYQKLAISSRRELQRLDQPFEPAER